MIFRRNIQNIISKCQFSSKNSSDFKVLSALDKELVRSRPDLNLEMITDSKNKQMYEKNIVQRKGIGNIERIQHLWESIQRFTDSEKENQGFATPKESEEYFRNLWDQMYYEAYLLPNSTHPETPIGDETNNLVVDTYGDVQEKDQSKTYFAEDLVKSWRSLHHPTKAAGNRSYFLSGYLAILEKAILNYVFNYVKNLGFVPVIVPDLIHNNVTVGCGVIQKADHNSIQYSVFNNPSLHLSGTAEMGLGALIEGKMFTNSNEFPKKFVALSRCYRPEVSNSAQEAKLYRVHEFFKIEMFSLCLPSQSSQMLEDFLQIQKDIFKNLEIPYRVLNMSSQELGASAYKKYDIEAWMKGRKMFGEVSSSSNCTDYQTRRLNVKFQNEIGEYEFLHTVNGTAVASTRTLISILENSQKGKTIPSFPSVLNINMDRGKWQPLKMKEASNFKYTD
uniref:Serine--tRNA ligase n=1 Tax=Rhabditophanes sp. KR3021 TaxID=114890 RepID=A0AC35TSL2_9BILA